MAHKLRGVAVEDSTARTEPAWHAAPDVRSPYTCERWPIKMCAVRSQQADPAGLCVAQVQSGLREFLQDIIRRGGHLLGQSNQGVVLGHVVGCAGWSPSQLSRRNDRIQIDWGVIFRIGGQHEKPRGTRVLKWVRYKERATPRLALRSLSLDSIIRGRNFG